MSFLKILGGGPNGATQCFVCGRSVQELVRTGDGPPLILSDGVRVVCASCLEDDPENGRDVLRDG